MPDFDKGLGRGIVLADLAVEAHAGDVVGAIGDDFQYLGIELLPLDEVLARADFITVHLPKTPETAGLLNREALAKTKVGLDAMHSTIGRHAARAVSAAVQVDMLAGQWTALVENIGKGDTKTFNAPTFPKGEVMGVGRTFGEAMLKSQLGAGSRLPEKGTVCISVKDGDKARAVNVAKDLVAMGFNVVATKGTAAAIAAAGVPVKPVNKVKDGRPHISDAIKAGEIQLVFTTVDETRQAIADSRHIRTVSLANRITYYTTMAGSEAATEAIKHQQGSGSKVSPKLRSLPTLPQWK